VSSWILASALAANAATFYVRSSGNDANSGTSPQRAFASITTAARYAVSPGDVVIVGPGHYQEGNITPGGSGAPALPIVLMGDSDGTSTGDAPGPVLVDAAQQYDAVFLLDGVSDTVIEGFHITGARTQAVYVVGPASNRDVIANNVIFSNGVSTIGRGVQVWDGAADTLVFNNLIYANASVGISVGGRVVGSANVRILNNTVYANGLEGIIIAAGGTSSPGAWVLNNITAGNALLGIDQGASGRCNYVAAYNLVEDGYDTATQHDPTDLQKDPVFVQPAGLDGILGGAGYADDNFALSTRQAGQPRLSPAVNAGSEPASVFGLDQATTRTDGAPDTGQVDIGFHAGNIGYPKLGAVPPIPPTTLYVRASGSDANDGLDPSHALATIQHAADVAPAETQIIVGPGSYEESVVGPQSLTPAGRVAFVADPTGTRTGDEAGPVLVDAGGSDTGFMILGRCSSIVDGFSVTNAFTTGIQVRAGSDGSIVRNNITFSNGHRGVDVTDSNDVQVINNLSYANGTGGIQVGGNAGSKNALVRNNSVYDNGYNGIQIGTGGGASTGARVLYNIMQGNGHNGIEIGSNTTYPLSLPGYVSGYNISSDTYGAGTPRPSSDLAVLAQFVNPSGPDGILGGAGFADDDFHLSSVEAGQPTDSPGVDYGIGMTAEMGDLADRSTRTDGIPDSGTLDIGFHYPSAESIYVNPAGSDDNSGMTLDLPLATIAKALSIAGPGDQVFLMPGVYEESDLQPGAGVAIKGASPGLAVIDARGGALVFDASNGDVSITDVGMTGSVSAAVRASGNDFRLVGCRVFDNVGAGVLLAGGQRALVFNNVVSGNGNVGLAVGADGTASLDATVMQNTIVANGAEGIAFGVAGGPPSTGGAIVNNILADNSGAGLAVGDGSDGGLLLSHNCNADGYAGVQPAPSDLQVDPILVNLPAGPSGAGDPLVASFYLSQVQAGQSQTSPCVDAGLGTPQRFGLKTTWTRTDDQVDGGRLDIGFHHGVPALSAIDVRALVRSCVGDCVPLVGDCNGDGRVTVDELMRGMRISLGEAPLASCSNFDSSGDRRVTVNELVNAVAIALAG